MAEDRLQLIRAGIRRVERETRTLKILVAKELDERDKAADTIDRAEEVHTNDRGSQAEGR